MASSSRGPLLQAAIIDDDTKDWSSHTIPHILSTIGQWQRDQSAKQQQQQQQQQQDVRLPFVLLTFAQTLDGMIASRSSPSLEDEEGSDTTTTASSSSSSSSSNLALSGAASFRLTHGLRSIHDAILIGGTTLATDHPRLTNRLWPMSPTNTTKDTNTTSTSTPTTTCHSSHHAQPRPVILDTHLRHYVAAGAWRVRNAIVCCSHEAASQQSQQRIVNDNDNNDNVDPNDLRSTVTFLPCRVSPMTGRLCLEHVLEQLKKQFGIRSIMVEGGATVLSEFASSKNLVSAICITIAPKLLGAKCGMPAFPNRPLPLMTFLQDNDSSTAAARSTPTFTTLGSDCIFLSKWPQS